MIIKVGNEVIDLNKVPVALCFATKEEAKFVGGILSNIKTGDSEVSDPVDYNYWFIVPRGWTKQQCDEFAALTPEQIKSDLPISGNLDFEL